MFARTILTLALVLGIALAAYILYGSRIVSQFATAGDREPNVELNAPEEALTQMGVVRDSRLTEISGIDASILNPNAYWVHNDSGHPADVYLITQSGETLMRVKLGGAKNIDWEDVSVFRLWGQPVVCIGDVGDNAGKRKTCQLYLFDEPEVPTAKSNQPAELTLAADDVTKIEFTYDDGPRNCEAIAYDPRGRSLLLFQKAIDKNEEEKAFGIYTLRFQPRQKKMLSNIAGRVADNRDRLTTGVDVSSDGKQILSCNYALGSYSAKPPALTWANYLHSADFTSIPLPVQRQREAICFTSDGKSAIVVSEFGKQPIWKVNLQPLLESKK